MGFDPISFLLGSKAGGGGGGGGGSAWTLIGSDEFEVSTTSTGATNIGSVHVDINNVNTNDILYVRVRDKAGKRNGYFYGSDSIIAMVKMKDEETGGDQTIGTFILGVNSSGKYEGINMGRCIYPSSFNNDSKTVIMSSRYYSNYGTIDGTYKVDVYKLTPPFTMFE